MRSSSRRKAPTRDDDEDQQSQTNNRRREEDINNNQNNHNVRNNNDVDQSAADITNRMGLESAGIFKGIVHLSGSMVAPLNIKVTPKQTLSFTKLTEEVRQQIVKATTRMILMKHHHGEAITRANVSDVLNQKDPAYKIHTSAALAQTQKTLFDVFGFGLRASDSSYMMVTNELAKTSPQLCTILVSSIPPTHV